LSDDGRISFEGGGVGGEPSALATLAPGVALLMVFALSKRRGAGLGR
jgi:hypothetical protein